MTELDFCADLSNADPQWTYAQLARCCRAWKDPALDRLWARLAGVGPLMALREGDAVSWVGFFCGWVQGEGEGKGERERGGVLYVFRLPSR